MEVIVPHLQSIFISQKIIHIATSSFIRVGNHQANDAKMNMITIILKSADPYLQDQVGSKVPVC